METKRDHLSVLTIQVYNELSIDYSKEHFKNDILKSLAALNLAQAFESHLKYGIFVSQLAGNLVALASVLM